MSNESYSLLLDLAIKMGEELHVMIDKMSEQLRARKTAIQQAQKFCI